EKLTTLKNVRQYLRDQKLDGLLVTSPYNRRYTTHFTGSAGVALITNDDALLMTDFRYVEQAEREATEFKIIQHEAQVIDEVKQQVDRLHITRLGFEAEHMTMALYSDYEAKIKSELIPTKGVIEQFRLIKTDEEITILKAAAKIADEAYEHILAYIKPGVLEIDIANELEYFMCKQGATQSSFDIIVASGVRSSLPHGTAS